MEYMMQFIRYQRTLNILFGISILYLHEFGFFHRNIKPDHVFLDNENKAYFGGFATICELNNTNNELIGSDTCQSPEQYKQNISTPYSDIYSYGVNVYYFITGQIGDRTGNFFVEDEKMKKLLKELKDKLEKKQEDLNIQMKEVEDENERLSESFQPPPMNDDYRGSFFYVNTVFRDLFELFIKF